MKRSICLLLATGMVISLTACAKFMENSSYLTVEAGETYTGTVSEISREHIVVSTQNGDVLIPYTEETAFIGFTGMGGRQQPEGFAGMPPDMNGGEMGQPESVERPDNGSESNVSDDETPPELPEGEESEHDSNDSAAQSLGDQSNADTSQNGGDMQQICAIEDVALNDEVEVSVDDNGIAETVTLANSGNDGNSDISADYEAVNEYTEDTEVSGETLESTGKDENAVLVGKEGITVTLNNVTLSRQSEDSTGGDNSSFYGVGAAALVTDGTLSISGSKITTDAPGGAGVFSYGKGVAYVSDTTITSEQDTSGGVHVADGGTLYAWDLTVETDGESSAAIRSDRGSGTMIVDGGTYTANGVGSPAVYSTADITVHDALLTAAGAEAACIEGLNTIRLFDCDLIGNMSDQEQNDCTWNVILYQSMSGDSEVGNSTFQMSGGSLTAKNGGMFYTTNTESTFILSDVEIQNAQESEFLLKCTGNSNQRGWGSAGANGADCHFTAIEQELEGDVIWDSISKLDFYLTKGSVLTGAVLQDESNAGDGGDGYATLYIDGESTWVVNGDSILTSLACAGTIIDAEGQTVSVVGTDGTVYVEGTSIYTVTVENYTSQADISEASSLESWSDYKVEGF